MARPKLSIVIPAYNEEKTIGNVINEVVGYGIVIVVDDGSMDDTARIATATGAVVVRHTVNSGYDCTLNTGFEKARLLDSEIILTFDADGQHSALLIEDFVTAIDDGADVVIGIRNKTARFAESVFSSIATKLWGIKDPLCGMKAYRSEVHQELGHFDSYNSIGTELCIFAAKQKFEIAQIPFEVIERVDKPRFGRVLNANWKIFRAAILGVLKYRWLIVERTKIPEKED